MNNCQHRVAVLVAVVMLAAPLRGQEEPASARAAHYVDERGGLALDAAIVRALEYQPSLRAVRADIAVARGLRQQAGLRPNPTVTFERRDEPGGTDTLTSVGLTWPLDLFRRSARVQSAEREQQVATLAVSDRERLLAAEVRLQYGVAAAAVRDVIVADDVVATAERQLNAVRARVETGAAPPLERDLLDVELRRVQADRFLAQGRADVVLVQLRQVLGMAPDEPLKLRDTIEALVAGIANEAAATRGSVGMRPDVREADARVSLAEARIEQMRREGRADVSLFGTYMRMDAGFPQFGVNTLGVPERVRGRFNYVAGGATVMLPWFNRNQGRVAAAEAERSGAQARRESAELTARAEIAAAEARSAQAMKAVGLYAGGMRTLARQNLDVVRQTYDLGRATVVEVLAEQRRYLELEQAYTVALREAWEARAALTQALGETK